MYLLLQNVTEGFLKDLHYFKSLILKQSEGLKFFLKIVYWMLMMNRMYRYQTK